MPDFVNVRIIMNRSWVNARNGFLRRASKIFSVGLGRMVPPEYRAGLPRKSLGFFPFVCSSDDRFRLLSGEAIWPIASYLKRLRESFSR